MAKGIHKGTELSNINETWQQNERSNEDNGDNESTSSPALPGNDLQQIIKEEAAEYENDNKSDRILPGERATVNDDNKDE